MKSAASSAVSDKIAASIALRSPVSPAGGDARVYDTQTAALVFCCGMVFKISSLPGLVASELASGTFWLYLFMMTVDALCLAATLLFAASGADEKFARTFSYRTLSLLLSCHLLLKGFVYFAYTVIFLTVDLFADVPLFVVVLVLALPVIYLGCKGVRGIARTAELLFPVLIFVILFDLVFLETDLDFGRNLPLRAMPAKEFFSRGLTFGMWLGDCFPLLFVRSVKKRPLLAAVETGASYAVVAVIALISVAMYGDALPYVYNVLVRLSGFNSLSLEIGRLEWASVFAVIVMAMLGLSLHMWGAAESCRRALGTPVPARLLFAGGIVIVTLSVPVLHDVAEFSVSGFGYAMFAAALFFAASFGALALKARREVRRGKKQAAADSAPEYDAARDKEAENG